MPRWDIVKFEEIMTAWLQESVNRIMNNLNKNEKILKVNDECIWEKISMENFKCAWIYRILLSLSNEWVKEFYVYWVNGWK